MSIKNKSGSLSFLQNIYQQISMSQKLSAKDSEYANYAGADFETAHKIAIIDLMKEHKLIPETYYPLLDLYRAYLVKYKKAYFATIGSQELTQLGFLLGVDKGGSISARNHDFSNYAEDT